MVHGSFGGGWEWREVARLLRDRGAEVFTPTLTGCGERAHLLRPDTDLETHIADVIGVLDSEYLSDVILVGQSYGGAIVAPVADRVPERLSQLVFVDAILPRHGESLLDQVPPAGAEMFRSLADPASNVIRSPGEPNAAKGSYDARMSWHPWKTFNEPARLGDRWRAVPATYVRCVSDDPISALLAPSAARARELGMSYVELESPHDAQWFKPAELTEILAGLVAERSMLG